VAQRTDGPVRSVWEIRGQELAVLRIDSLPAYSVSIRSCTGAPPPAGRRSARRETGRGARKRGSSTSGQQEAYNSPPAARPSPASKLLVVAWRPLPASHRLTAAPHSGCHTSTAPGWHLSRARPVTGHRTSVPYLGAFLPVPTAWGSPRAPALPIYMGKWAGTARPDTLVLLSTVRHDPIRHH